MSRNPCHRSPSHRYRIQKVLCGKLGPRSRAVQWTVVPIALRGSSGTIYEHLPPVFRPLEGAGDPDQLALPRVAALRYLSRTILGTGGDLNGLVRFVNQEWDGPCGPITPEVGGGTQGLDHLHGVANADSISSAAFGLACRPHALQGRSVSC